VSVAFFYDVLGIGLIYLMFMAFTSVAVGFGLQSMFRRQLVFGLISIALSFFYVVIVFFSQTMPPNKSPACAKTVSVG
jgi:hypothetical protein